jgi:hypothetical protein
MRTGGRGIPAFSHCSTTANPSLSDDGFKKMFNKKPAWLRADLKGNQFKFPHSTCTKPLVISNARKHPTNNNLILIKVNYYLPLSGLKTIRF